MNRMIKFRGKRLDNGEWLYGSLSIIYGDRAAILPPNVINHYRVFPATVGQFTGLTDKSGKEIYEGDIIHAMGSIDLIVKWDGNNACFFADYDATRHVIDDDRDDFCNACDFSTYYVIGNVHDNPRTAKNK